MNDLARKIENILRALAPSARRMAISSRRSRTFSSASTPTHTMHATTTSGMTHAAKAWRSLRAAARAHVCPFLRDDLRIVPAALGEDAGLVGAAQVVWQAGDAAARRGEP